MLYLEFKILQHINPNTAIKVILPKKKKKLFAARNQIMNHMSNKDRIKILVQKLKIKIKLQYMQLQYQMRCFYDGNPAFFGKLAVYNRQIFWSKKNFHKREREMLNQKKMKNRKSNTFLDDPEVVSCKWHVKSKVCSSDNKISSNICDYSSP